MMNLFQRPTISLPRNLRFISNIKDRRRTLDVDLWKQRPFVIVDPSDPEEILYLREGEFHQYQRVSLSNGINLTIIARDTTPQDQIGPLPSNESSSQDESTPEESSQTATTSDHLKKSPPILGLIGMFYDTKDNLLVELTTKNVVSLCFKYIVKLYYWTSGSQSVYHHKAALDFSRSMLKILEHQGPMGVVLRLKVSLIAVNAFVGGSPLKSTHPLGTFVALSNGLPKWLPRTIRRRIRERDLTTIRIWVSVFNIYKALKGSWKDPSLKDITSSPIPESEFWDINSFAEVFWAQQRWVPQRLLRNVNEFCDNLRRQPRKYFCSSKAGPNGKFAFRANSVMLDALAWMKHPEGPFEPLFVLCELFGLNYLIDDIEDTWHVITTSICPPLSEWDQFLFYLYSDPEAPLNAQIIAAWRGRLKKGAPDAPFRRDPRTRDYINLSWEEYEAKYKASPYRKVTDDSLYIALARSKCFRHLGGRDHENLCFVLTGRDPFVPKLGRLHNIQEAAGKNRIIALNDFWSQQALKPLHKWLFKICEFLPQDSTFDQEGSLERFTKREDITEYFSYDLSAATDMIPTGLYKAILSPLIGQEKADAWIALLTDKDFVVPFRNAEKLKKVRYTRGQPMGALSSWGLLNLSHHIVIQYSRVYAILKDLVRLKDRSKYWEFIPAEAMVLRSAIRETEMSSSSWRELWLEIVKLCSDKSFYEKVLPFDKYVVLGDDVVIGDRETADAYYELMTQRFGVSIKLPKSYVSNTLLNFANQTYYNGDNISPFPFRELIAAKGILARLELASRVVRRWFIRTSVVSYLRMVLTSSIYARFKAALGRGIGPFRPILPVLFALTLVRAPIIGMIPETDADTDVRDRICALGAFSGRPRTFYKTLVSGADYSSAWKRITGEAYASSEEFRQYVMYLVKYIADGQVGSIEDLTAPLTLDLETLGLGRLHIPLLFLRYDRRYQLIHMENAVDGILDDIEILYDIAKCLNNPKAPIEELVATLKIMIDNPDVFGTFKLISRLIKTVEPYIGTLSPMPKPAALNRYGYTGSVQHNREMEVEAELFLMPDHRGWEDTAKSKQTKQAQMIQKIIQATAKFIDLGGSLASGVTPETADCLSTPCFLGNKGGETS